MFAPNKDALGEAKLIIEKLLEEMKEPELEFGGIYTGKIVEVRANGVLIQLYPSMSPVLLPNSQLDRRRVRQASIEPRPFFLSPVRSIIRVCWASTSVTTCK